MIGCADAPLVHQWLRDGMWSYTNSAWHVGTVRLDRPSSGVIFSPALPCRRLTYIHTQRFCFVIRIRTTTRASRFLSSPQTPPASSAPFDSSRSAPACSRPTGSSSTAVQTRLVPRVCRVQGMLPLCFLSFSSSSHVLRTLACMAGSPTRAVKTLQTNGSGTNACHGLISTRRQRDVTSI